MNAPVILEGDPQIHALPERWRREAGHRVGGSGDALVRSLQVYPAPIPALPKPFIRKELLAAVRESVEA